MNLISALKEVGLMIGAFAARLAVIHDFLFGCHHGHLSRVFTLEDETYRVCFDCGAKFEYSLENVD